MTRPGLPILVLIAAGVIASFFYDPGQLISPESEFARYERTLPQTYLERTRSWSYDEEGALSEIMEAASVRHYARGDESLLVAPRYYSHSGDDRTWSAVADRGSYRARSQLLTLQDHVVLTNDASGGRLRTERMTISMRQKVARSDVAVTITQGADSTRADGMRADLERERIVMKPNVESTYVLPE